MDVEGAIFDLTTRKPVPSNEELMRVFQLLQRSEDFETLPEIRRVK